MTLEDDPHELFKSEAASLHFADLSLVYSMLGSTDSFHVVSFYRLVSRFSDSSNFADGPTCPFVTELQTENYVPSFKALFFTACFGFRRWNN